MIEQTNQSNSPFTKSFSANNNSNSSNDDLKVNSILNTRKKKLQNTRTKQSYRSRNCVHRNTLRLSVNILSNCRLPSTTNRHKCKKILKNNKRPTSVYVAGVLSSSQHNCDKVVDERDGKPVSVAKKWTPDLFSVRKLPINHREPIPLPINDGKQFT